ncbi:metal-dependent hydrolase, partial [Escherichia coli]|uniref:metal-dependent hydrolase n=1 Tax=Escherichia coli TaxID=562 RepID=UPI0022AC690D
LLMPSGKTHLAIGIGASLALGSCITFNHDFWWKLGLTSAICIIGALSPDLDIDNNELEEMSRTHTGRFARRARNVARDSDLFDKVTAWTFGSVFGLIGEIVSRILEALAWIIQRLTTHRGLTHSFLAWSFTTAVALFFSQRYD